MPVNYFRRNGYHEIAIYCMRRKELWLKNLII